MRLSSYRRIYEQDYKSDDQELVKKLGIPINASFEELYNALNNKLTFKDNFNTTIAEFTVTVDDNGNPKTSTTFKLTNNQTSVEGLMVLNVTNSEGFLPTGGIFVSFSKNDGYVSINNIKGLQPLKQYKIKVLALA